MGRDKATLDLAGDGIGLAERTARLLAGAAGPCLEVGPGWSGLPCAPEDHPGQGPLAAIVAGTSALQAAGWPGPVLVVATDLPFLSLGMLTWLAGWPGSGSLVPVDCGRPQPLCARYAPEDLDVAASLVGSGRRSMGDLLDAIRGRLVGPEVWSGPAGRTDALEDVDTPEDVARLTGLTGQCRPEGHGSRPAR